MIIAELAGTIVVNTIVATLEEAIQAFPESTWVACPSWIGVGMDINTPEPSPVVPEVIKPVVQPISTGTQAL